jgi:hypothetical protein
LATGLRTRTIVIVATLDAPLDVPKRVSNPTGRDYGSVTGTLRFVPDEMLSGGR